MADPVNDNTATATPVPVDTQSAPITGTPQSAESQGFGKSAPQLPQNQPAPPSKPAPGEFFGGLAHAFTGAVLGAMAGREKTTGYTTDETGKQTPIESKMTSGDQLRQIARSALLGLAAGANAPKQKSGLASALGGLGAGAEDAVERNKEQDALMRKQSSEEFERGQQALTNKAVNAHTAIETIRAAQEIRNTDLESQGKFAALGQDALGAAIAGGNSVPVQDMHMDDIVKYRQDHPEYLNYTPVLTKVTPKEGVDPKDPNGVDRYYSLIDYTKPVEVTPGMISHLKAVGFPGAESLEPGQKIDPQQFKGLWYQGLKMYNDALRDPKNKDVIDVTAADGTPMKAVYNKTLGTTEILRDEKGQPLGGKIETGETKLMGADNKIYSYLYNKQNGKLLKNLGESGDTQNAMGQTYGDMSLKGPEYLNTVPQPYKNDMTAIGQYSMQPSDFGRSSAGRMGLLAGVAQAFPGFDEKNYKERYDYIKQYQSGSTGDGASRTRLNTATSHLDMLGQAADALKNNDVRFFNTVANEFGYQTGLSPKVAYDVIARKAAGEAAGAIKGGAAATEPEIDAVFKDLNSSNSPAQQRSAIHANLGLLRTQSDTLRNNFKQAMGTTDKEFGRPVLSDQNQAIMDKWTTTQSGNGQGALPPGVPKEATHVYRDNSGNVQGYALNGKYVPLGAK